MKLHDPTIDYRAHPERYRIGRGEQGVLTVEPYKSEILPHWRFRTEEEAEKSAATIVAMFEEYRRQNDFVGMDMARKFLQMGYTRARRYARHRSGRKYGPDGNELPEDPDPEKQLAAAVFHRAWSRVREDEIYQHLKNDFLK